MTMPPHGYPAQGPQQGPQGPQQRPQGPPPQGPPPGGPNYPAQQYHQQTPPRSPAQRAATAVAVLALVSLLGVVLGLSISEDDRTAWDSVNAWGGLAIAGAALTMVPAFGHAIGLGAQRAWQVAACGAGALILFWVLFTLPEVGSNTSLLTTIGVAAGVIAVWIAPGHTGTDPGGQAQPPRTWVSDPLPRLPTNLRLWLATLLCLTPMGLVWQTNVTPGTTLYGDCGYSTGPYCVPDSYLPGSVGSTTVAQSPIRVFLVAGVVLLALCAATPRTDTTRRLARIATAGLVPAAALAAAHGSSRTLLSILLALALAAPPAWRGALQTGKSQRPIKAPHRRSTS